ncbi:MAG: toprim domain-containing protein [Candidatus Ranarchaeia archaeon]
MRLQDHERHLILEKFEDILDRIRTCSEEGTYLIVEGKNDTIALNALQITKNIIQIHSNQHPLIQLEQLIGYKSKVLILTDFDEEGEAIAKRLQVVLASRKPRFLTSLRNRLRETVSLWVRTIEGLYRFYRHLKQPLDD